jgi:hypothetical protein
MASQQKLAIMLMSAQNKFSTFGYITLTATSWRGGQGDVPERFSLGRQAPARRRTLIPSTLLRGTPRASQQKFAMILMSAQNKFSTFGYITLTATSCPWRPALHSAPAPPRQRRWFVVEAADGVPLFKTWDRPETTGQ